MNPIEQYFRSYFENEEDITAFYLQNKVSVHEESPSMWSLLVMDGTGRERYSGSDYPHSMMWYQDQRKEWTRVTFWHEGKRVHIETGGLPKEPLWLNVET